LLKNLAFNSKTNLIAPKLPPRSRS